MRGWRSCFVMPSLVMTSFLQQLPLHKFKLTCPPHLCKICATLIQDIQVYNNQRLLVFMSQAFLASNYLLLVNQDKMSPMKKYEEQESRALMMMINALGYELASLRRFKGLLQLGTAAREFLFFSEAFEAASPS